MSQVAAAPNWVAMLALLAWPLAAVWLYKTRPVSQATLLTILGAYLLLPVGASIKLAEGIPQLDKTSIPNLAALAGVILIKGRLRIWTGFGVVEVLLLMLLVGPFVTSELNADPVVSGSIFLPSLGAYDGLSAVFAQFIFVIPFFLGQQLYRTSANFEEILRILVTAGLLYSLPMLFEVRMSPQLHSWIYGYYPFGFITQMRYGGFRPSVFMENGLVAAFFAATATIAAAAFWRTKTRVFGFRPAGITVYLSALLVLCKSLGALIYGALLAPLVRLTGPKLQLRVAMVLVSIAVAYPLLRAEDLVPTKYILDAATMISAERAESLKVRFDNEQQLLGRASQRVLFGWGRWGRSRIYDPYGKDVSLTDGRWAITLGQFGIIGFLAEFGLLALPVFRAASALRFAESQRDGIFLGTVALIVGVNMIDLLPNASLSPWTWLLAGALLGRAGALRGATRQLRRVDRPVGEGEGQIPSVRTQW